MNTRIFGFDASILLPNLALLGLLAVGYMVTDAPFRPQRPSGAASGATAAQNEVAMYLWEDPFSRRPDTREIKPAAWACGACLWVRPPLAPAQCLPSCLKKPVTEPGGAAPKEVAAQIQSELDNSSATKVRERRGNLGLGHPRASQDGGARSAATNSVLILPVLVREADDPLEVELRLRTRYAVHAALARAQFLPRNRDKMSFYGSPESKRSVPYELFYLRPLVADGVRLDAHPYDWSDLLPESPEEGQLRFSHDHAAVLVVWVAENDLFKRGIVRTDNPGQIAVLEVLEKEMRQLLPTGQAAELVVLGPTNSDRLLGLMNDPAFAPDAGEALPGKASSDTKSEPQASAEETPLKTNQGPWRRKRLLVSQATVGSYAMELTLGRELGNRTERIESSRPERWGMRRTTATDDALAKTLLDELERRAAKPPTWQQMAKRRTADPERDYDGLDAQTRHIVLVSEWDTLYARALPRSFVTELNRSGAPANTSAAEDYFFRAHDHPCVHEFSYLRGLDGAGLGTSKPQNAGASSSSGATGASDLERAQGSSQFDYLRRLTWRIHDMDERLRREGRGRVAAIGVLGSDVYDKLLVLQALRGSFPGVVFFTTDLDAALLEKGQREWAQNLVVASAFGLSASEVLQQRIPPFRSSLQTGTYLTTLAALGLREAGGQSYNLQSDMSEPKLYEIGRTRIHELDTTRRLFPLPQADVHDDGVSAARTRIAWWGWLVFGLMVATGAGVFVFLLKTEPLRAGSWQDRLWQETPIKWLLQAAVVLLWYAITVGYFILLGRITNGMPLAGMFVCYGVMLTIYALMVRPIAHWLGGSALPSRSWRVAAAAAFLVVMMAGGIQFAIVAQTVVRGVGEEPFVAFDGVSAWPTALVRVLAGLVAAACLIGGQQRVKRELDELGQDEELEEKGEKAASPLARWQNAWHRPHKLARAMLYPICRPGATPETEAEPWSEYRSHLRFSFRFARILGYLAFNGFLVAVLMFGVGLEAPAVPVRGGSSIELNQAVLGATVALYLTLLYMVFDLMVITVAYIRRLEHGVSKTLSDERDRLSVVRRSVLRDSWNEQAVEEHLIRAKQEHDQKLRAVVDGMSERGLRTERELLSDLQRELEAKGVTMFGNETLKAAVKKAVRTNKTFCAETLCRELSKEPIGDQDMLDTVEKAIPANAWNKQAMLEKLRQARTRPPIDDRAVMRSLRCARKAGDAVFPLIYGPFAVMLLMIISRNAVFDSWDWPPMLLMIFAFSIVVIATGAGTLHHAAGRLKERMLERFDTQMVRLLDQTKAEPDAPTDKLLGEMREQVKRLQSGVFSPWYGNPIYRALLIPLGGMGTIQLLEKWVNALGS